MDEIEDAIDTTIDNVILEIGQLICQNVSHRFIKAPLNFQDNLMSMKYSTVIHGGPMKSCECPRMYLILCVIGLQYASY